MILDYPRLHVGREIRLDYPRSNVGLEIRLD